MTDVARRRWSAQLVPYRAGFARACLEGIAGFVLFGLISRLETPHVAVLFGVAASAWLPFWPAWRLSTLHLEPTWKRLALGIARALVCATLLGIVNVLVWPWLGPSAMQMAVRHSYVAVTMFLFVVARVALTLARLVRRRVLRRLRWQLTVSYLAVIFITFVAMAALASTIVVLAVATVLQPSPREMADAVAGVIGRHLEAGKLDRVQVRDEIGDIVGERVRIKGEFALSSLIGAPNLGPDRILIADPRGRLITSATSASLNVSCLRLTATPLSRSLWRELQPVKRRGDRPVIQLQCTSTNVDRSRVNSASQLVTAAPIANAGRRIVAVAVVQAPDVISIGSIGAFLRTLIALFGVTTVLLSLAMSLPVLALSALFGYVLARSLTRRLESVSRVATAIAAGDLKQRVSMPSTNEIGLLADDVNRMADSLQTAMDELRVARAKAVEALRLRQELVANISHDLRTPLAILHAHLDTISMQAPAVAGAGSADHSEVMMSGETLQALQRETEHLAALVDDLFALARTDTGALDVHLEPVDVVPLIDELVQLMRPLAQREGAVALTADLPPALPRAMADRERLSQILSNLIRNAVRHTPEGGIIAVSASVEPGWIVILVADTGEGIPPEHLPHIFERFYRVDEARTHSSGGAGLGLAIVREFVERMGGHVTVESAPGEGSCFRVYLPAAST